MIRTRKASNAYERKKNRARWQRRAGVFFSLILIIIIGFMIQYMNRGDRIASTTDPDNRSNQDNPAISKPNAATDAVKTPTPSIHIVPTSSMLPTSNNHSSNMPNPTANPLPNALISDSSHVTFAFVGDVLLASGVDTLMKKNGYDYPYRDVKSYLHKPDLTIANLESSVSDRGKAAENKEYVYRASPLSLPALAEAGIDLVNLANNHVMDYGTEGLLDTLDYLDRAKISRVGAGRDAAEAFKPVIIEKKGIKIAFLSYSRVVPDHSWKAGVNKPGVADTYNYTLPVESIKQASRQADLVVVIAHWGLERKDRPEAYQTDLAHRFIDAGADLIVGSHPHVLQGFEQYKGKWIAYSLGNFIFTTNEVKETLDSIILNVACSKALQCQLSVVPIFTQWAKPVVMNEEAGKRLLARLNSISYQVKVNPNGQVQ